MRWFLPIVMTALVLFGCADLLGDSSGPQDVAGGHITIDGTTYPLTGGALAFDRPVASPHGVYDWDLLLFDDGLSYDDAFGYPGNLTGTGNLMQLRIHTSVAFSVEGLYAIPDRYYDETAAGDMSAAFYIDRSSFNTYGQLFSADSGVMIVQESGESYHIAWSLADGPQTIAGEYDGSLARWTFSDAFNKW